MELVETEARRVAPVFSGLRLLALRELRGETQAAIADATGITTAALSQAERGDTMLSAANIARVSYFFGVMPGAFAERREPTIEMRPQFRHLRRTSARKKRMAERFVLAAASVASVLRDRVEFPKPLSISHSIDPELAIDDVAQKVEHAAAATRNELGLPNHQPIGTALIDRLEEGGVTVVRDCMTDRNIDAYSAVVGNLPVIVLDGSEGSVWDRDNFNLAHELGHIVMHCGISHIPGARNVEAQAHRFASAFLAPREAMCGVLPRELDWGRYLELKREWGVSMAALVRRAKDLEIIDELMFTRAMKQQSAYGWRKSEPGSTDRTLRLPRLLQQAMAIAGMSISNLAELAHLPEEVVRRIVGDPVPSVVRDHS